MTAFASNILAALSGAAAKPGAGGVGVAEGAGGGFEALLAGLIGEAAASAPSGGGDKSGSNLLLQADAAKAPDDGSRGQAAAEALLAATLPVVAPAPTAATPEPEAAPPAATAANALAFAVDAAVDATLPAPAELALDVATAVIAEAVATDVPAQDAPTAPTVTPAAPAELEAPVARAADAAAASAPSAAPVTPSPKAAAADPALLARTDLPAQNGGKTGADAVAPTSVGLKAPAPVAEAAAQPAAAPAPRGEIAPAPAPAEPQPASQARTTAEAAAPASEAAKSVRQAATTVAAVSTPAVEPRTAFGSTPAAAPPAPVDAEAPVVVTPAAIAQAAVDPQALPPETAAAIAATVAPAARPITAPTDARRTVKTADVRTNLEADPVGPRSEKAAAKVAEVQSSIVEAALDAAPEAPLVAPVELADADLVPQSAAEGVAAEPAAIAAAPRHAEAAPVVRGSPETVQKLAADIIQKLNGQNSRFDLQLDPLGLGKVDVSVEINADGRLTAALSFDSAAAAADLRGRSAELRQALQQAGFEVSDSGLSFDMAGQNPGFGGREAGDQSRGQWSGRAFQTAQAGLDDADARLTAALSSSSRTPSGGVDIRI